MSAYPWSDKNESGTWEHTEINGQKVVLFACPNCGNKNSLADHEIDQDGLVFPKLDCAGSSCGFNQYIELKGWGER